jgi:hypothetical protein
MDCNTTGCGFPAGHETEHPCGTPTDQAYKTVSAERRQALGDIAAGLRQYTSLDACVKDEHKPMDYLFLADCALGAALNGGTVMMVEEHRRKMRELARELAGEAL